MPERPPSIIVSAKRTPIGAFQVRSAPVTATELGAASIRGALADAGLAGDAIEEVIMGCVLPAGLGQAPARQAALGAGIPQVRARHHHQQDVRLGHEGRDDGRATRSAPAAPRSWSPAASSR